MELAPDATRPTVLDGHSRRHPVAARLFLPFRLLYKAWLTLVFFTSLLVLYLPFKVLLHKPARYRAAFRLKRAWAFFLQWAGFFPAHVRRLAPLPPPPCVICSNHSSYLDIIGMYNVVPQYFLFMGKNELRRWPLFRIFFKDMDIAVDRASRSGAARAFIRASQALDAGTSIAIFPEGTIPDHTPRLKPFKDGAFRLAIAKQVPIVPITFVDHWRRFGEPVDPMGRACPGPARVVVHRAIPTAGLTEADLVALRKQVFETIERPLVMDARPSAGKVE
ncbi:MAG: lysophospholipid acyltransferase family protein [Flavobacteriales bacterium]|jgi:1-acyl-sn-glycerol-3-phosphate acyltransferase|nr:lysophospholipid acyltransferase family protein [Flavobacteriales bacterium]